MSRASRPLGLNTRNGILSWKTTLGGLIAAGAWLLDDAQVTLNGEAVDLQHWGVAAGVLIVAWFARDGSKSSEEVEGRPRGTAAALVSRALGLDSAAGPLSPGYSREIRAQGGGERLRIERESPPASKAPGGVSQKNNNEEDRS